jgi:pimeloyl-ACP methyl ester carboxylesterase
MLTLPPMPARPDAANPKRGYFYVGGRYVDVPEGTVMVDQCYVSWQKAEPRTARHPLVFVHGGGQTGTNFDGTPDGRLGWADYFCGLGFDVYVVDQPARGRSPYHAEIHGPVRSIATKDVAVIERRLTAMSRYEPYPQATLHTQWPGTGLRGDPAFDEFCASQIRMVADFGLVERMMRAAGRALLERIGPAIVLTHSHSGSLGWNIADECPELVAAIVAVEPAGPPFVTLELVGGEDYAQERGLERPYGVTAEPLAYDPPVADPIAELWAGGDHRPDGAPAFWHLQPEPARRLVNVGRVPVVVVTGEASYHAVFDDATVAYLRQAGVDVDHVHLADEGVRGNGHMMMLELNNLDVADVIVAALERHGVR